MKNLFALALFCLTSMVFSQQPNGPYFLMSTENALIPLKENITEVRISGTVARVHTTQVYQNLGTKAIEVK